VASNLGRERDKKSFEKGREGRFQSILTKQGFAVVEFIASDLFWSYKQSSSLN